MVKPSALSLVFTLCTNFKERAIIDSGPFRFGEQWVCVNTAGSIDLFVKQRSGMGKTSAIS